MVVLHLWKLHENFCSIIKFRNVFEFEVLLTRLSSSTYTTIFPKWLLTDFAQRAAAQAGWCHLYRPLKKKLEANISFSFKEQQVMHFVSDGVLQEMKIFKKAEMICSFSVCLFPSHHQFFALAFTYCKLGPVVEKQPSLRYRLDWNLFVFYY